MKRIIYRYMFRKFHLIIIQLIFIIGLSSCNSDTEEYLVDITHLTNRIEDVYDCSNPMSDMHLKAKVQFLVIENKTDYDNKVGGICHPVINFQEYNLIIGRLLYSIEEIKSLRTTLYISSCEPGLYRLYNNIIENRADEKSDEHNFITYHLLIPKSEDVEILRVTHSVGY